MQLQVNDEIILPIHDIGIHGEGIGKYRGFTVFVDGALPGESVKIKIIKKKKSYAVGIILEILKKSQNRISPPCAFFPSCGGCQIQHASYKSQLKIKRKRVEDAIQRIGKIKTQVGPCIPSTSEYSYRNKIQYPINNQGYLGLYKRGSHQIVPIDQCLLHMPAGETIYEYLQAKILEFEVEPYNEKTMDGELRHVIIRTSLGFEDCLIGLVTSSKASEKIKKLACDLYHHFDEIKGVMHIENRSETNRILSQTIHTLFGEDSLKEKIGPYTFTYSIESFFQVNPSQAEKLYQTAIDLAQVGENDTVIDAFCGVGTLSIYFAKKAKFVYGIECVGQAVLHAKKNAIENDIENCKFIHADVDKHLKKLKPVDWIVINPPRKGCGPETLSTIISHRPLGIVYISCDPATLARDLQALTENYDLETVQPFDMFPQTMHVETLCILKKKKI